jgi:uncharacterized protein YhbP (UPF0306 family)
MAKQLSSDVVWKAVEKELFAVMGMVTRQGQARTVGIVYVVSERKLYIATETDTWKARHVAANPHVSLTVPIAKRIPFLPWIKIPAATITFSGEARRLPAREAPQHVLKAVLRGLVLDDDVLDRTCIIEVTPLGEFVTYGVDMPMMQMRHPEQARGRAPVA